MERADLVGAGVSGATAGRTTARPAGWHVRRRTVVEPDLAVRSRLNAAVLDGVLISILVGIVVGLLGLTMLSPETLPLIYALQFLYFFLLEARGGQTVGKRAMKVRVVALDGSPATVRMYAARNALRFVDALPLLYTSGLVSLMRTGAARRQRLGDIVAGTTVTADGAPRLRTPGWLLPTAAVVALVLSCGYVLGSFDDTPRHLPARMTKVDGFAGDTSVAPRPGLWRAHGIVTSSTFGNDGVQPVGTQVDRLWQITRSCVGRRCAFTLTRQVLSGPPLRSALVHRRDGWHATFLVAGGTCRTPGGAIATWSQRSFWVLRFRGGGTAVEAHERNVTDGGACGAGTDTLEWSARRR